jgi:hypothetical protein
MMQISMNACEITDFAIELIWWMVAAVAEAECFDKALNCLTLAATTVVFPGSSISS